MTWQSAMPWHPRPRTPATPVTWCSSCSPEARSVMLGKGNVAAYMHTGQTFIDTSSINPVVSKMIATELAKRPSP